jgi:hypothetical protein
MECNATWAQPPHGIAFGNGVGLTSVGMEIIGLVRANPDEGFVKALIAGFRIMGLRLQPAGAVADEVS